MGQGSLPRIWRLKKWFSLIRVAGLISLMNILMKSIGKSNLEWEWMKSQHLYKRWRDLNLPGTFSNVKGSPLTWTELLWLGTDLAVLLPSKWPNRSTAMQLFASTPGSLPSNLRLTPIPIHSMRPTLPLFSSKLQSIPGNSEQINKRLPPDSFTNMLSKWNCTAGHTNPSVTRGCSWHSGQIVKWCMS